ncbi:MAG: DUF4870 domain-containing protein [Proteobacteria bacterium]|nr:DUF4870 domain-containing protein [Pseudomonadota bacterium]
MTTPPLPPQLDPGSGDAFDDALPPGFPSNEERNWAVFCHLGGFAFYLLGFALGHILVPLALWLMKREGSAFVDENGREALNFQISVTLYAIVTGALCFVLVGFLLIPVLMGFHIVLMIVASVRASQGESYRYPLTIRLI